EKVEIAVPIDIDEESTHVFIGGHLAERRAHPHRKDRLTFGIEAPVQEESPRLAFRATEVEIGKPVTVDVAPGLAGSELGVLVRQERLPQEVVKGRLRRGERGKSIDASEPGWHLFLVRARCLRFFQLSDL